MYPISDRCAETLLPLIGRHVELAQQITHMDCLLTAIRTRLVLSTRKKKPTQSSLCTPARLKVLGSIHRIILKRMYGTRSAQFEGHMAEIMWPSDVKGQVYNEFCLI